MKISNNLLNAIPGTATSSALKKTSTGCRVDNRLQDSSRQRSNLDVKFEGRWRQIDEILYGISNTPAFNLRQGAEVFESMNMDLHLFYSKFDVGRWMFNVHYS